jgi:hypothetical protein
LTQQNPEKRAKKLIKRAINKAKRVASQEVFDLESLPVDQAVNKATRLAQEAFDLEPLPVDHATSLPSVYLLSTGFPIRPPLIHSQSAPAHHDIALLRFPMRLPLIRSLSTQALMLNNGARLEECIPPPPPMGCVSPSIRYMLSKDFEALASIPPSLNAMSSKEWFVEALAAIPSSLNAMTSREWFMDDGYTMQEDDFENIDKLFDAKVIRRSSAPI